MRFPLLALLVPLAACAPRPLPTGHIEGVAIAATPLPLDPAEPSRERIGALRWLGTLHLTAADKRLGGLSSLRWREGMLYAASDQGDFFAFRPREAGDRLIGVDAVRVARLSGADGRPLVGKAASDFEALELLPAAGPPEAVVLSLESDSALWRYRLAQGLPVGTPTPLGLAAAWRAAQSHTNGGIEALAGDGATWLMVSEEMREADGGASAILVTRGRELRLGVPIEGGFKPTDLVRLPGADARYLLLERWYRKGIGTAMRLVRLRIGPRGAGAETLATLDVPMTVDNMEGLALRQEGARTFLYMVSDDNFSDTQRTLLMKWELVG